MRVFILLLTVLIAAAIAFAVMLGIGASVGTITTTALDGERPPRTWEEVFAAPAAVKVTAFVTGWVEAGPDILIDPSNPRTPEAYRKRIWVPSPAYLIEHPLHGRVLLDTGVKAGDCAYGTPPAYWVPCRNTADSDAVSQLKGLGFTPRDLRYIVVSHFHGDHVSGLGALLAGGAPAVVTTRAEIDVIESPFRVVSGFEASMLQADFKAVLVDQLMQPMPIVGTAADLFGDGSLWLIPAPGHTAGHLAALINARPKPLLLTFDTAHLRANFDLDIIPGTHTDRAAAEASLAKLRAFAKAHPELQVVFGHEPSQWEGRGRTFALVP